MSGPLIELIEALRTARSAIFRLECRQHYPDDPQWQAFEADQDWTANEDLAWWCDLVRANTARGVVMTRVHVVTTPWTPYVRFEVERHYPWNVAAGEGVRLVHAAEPWAVTDFWLVDDAGWELSYDPEGAMSVEAVASDGALRELRRCRDWALRESSPLSPPFTS